jgi:hypothetical protein
MFARLSFMENIDRIFSPNYIPNYTDVLNTRVRTVGITQELFNCDGCAYRVFDVGGERTERKKWIHCFENADIVLMQVSLGTYDQTDSRLDDQVSTIRIIVLF